MRPSTSSTARGRRASAPRSSTSGQGEAIRDGSGEAFPPLPMLLKRTDWSTIGRKKTGTYGFRRGKLAEKGAGDSNPRRSFSPRPLSKRVPLATRSPLQVGKAKAAAEHASAEPSYKGSCPDVVTFARRLWSIAARSRASAACIAAGGRVPGTPRGASAHPPAPPPLAHAESSFGGLATPGFRLRQAHRRGRRRSLRRACSPAARCLPLPCRPTHRRPERQRRRARRRRPSRSRSHPFRRPPRRLLMRRSTERLHPPARPRPLRPATDSRWPRCFRAPRL